MKKFTKLILVFMFVFMLFGCNDVKYYEVSLDGYGISDYNWTYEIEDESILSIVEEKYYGEESNDEIKGLGGQHVFKVMSLKEGKTRVNFNYTKAWDENSEILYSYYIDFEVDKNLELKVVSESGNYISLMKFLSYNYEDLGLELDFNDYVFRFSNAVSDSDEFDWLVVYDYEENYIDTYAISISNDKVYRSVDKEMVLVEKD